MWPHTDARANLLVKASRPGYAITATATEREPVIAETHQEGNEYEGHSRDALNLIRHWKEESAQLHCTCASEGVGFQLTGRITELSDSVLSITRMACEALIPLDGVSYHYHGSQDIPTAIKQSLQGTFVSVLELRLRTGGTVVMAEVRTASSPAERPQ